MNVHRWIKMNTCLSLEKLACFSPQLDRSAHQNCVMSRLSNTHRNAIKSFRNRYEMDINGVEKRFFNGKKRSFLFIRVNGKIVFFTAIRLTTISGARQIEKHAFCLE